MATERFRTIRPTGQGGDYASLAAAITGELGANADLVAADLFLVLEIQGDWSAAADATALINGFTTDATRYLEIRADAANRYNGVWSASKYRIASTTNGNLRIGDPFVRVSGLQVEPLGGGALYGIGLIGGGSDALIVDCAVKGSGSTLCYGSVSTGGGTVRNCVSFGGAVGYSADGTGTIEIQHHTAYGHTTGVARNAGTLNSTNGLAQNCATAFAGTIGGDYNCDEDGTAPGANSFTDTASFTDAANGDLHLTAALSQQGSDLSGSGVTTDFEGDPRSATPDVGADERSAGWPDPPAGTTRVLTSLRRMQRAA